MIDKFQAFSRNTHLKCFNFMIWFSKILITFSPMPISKRKAELWWTFSIFSSKYCSWHYDITPLNFSVMCSDVAKLVKCLSYSSRVVSSIPAAAVEMCQIQHITVYILPFSTLVEETFFNFWRFIFNHKYRYSAKFNSLGNIIHAVIEIFQSNAAFYFNMSD